MKQTTISNVNVGFELLIEALGNAMDEVQPSSISARRAVSCCIEKIAEVMDCWKAVVKIHCLADEVKAEAEDKASNQNEPVIAHEKIDREHGHWGYDPCPLRVVIDGKDLLADDADGIGTHKRNAWKLFVKTIETVGEDRVASLNLLRYTRDDHTPFMTKNRELLGDSKQIRMTKNGYYVNTNLNNWDKMAFLNTIFKRLGMNAECTIMNPRRLSAHNHVVCRTLRDA